jgi:hypothetical protein
MKKINVKTMKKTLAEVSFCNSTLTSEEVIELVKKNCTITGYDEIEVYKHDKVILFVKYVHVIEL